MRGRMFASRVVAARAEGAPEAGRGAARAAEPRGVDGREQLVRATHGVLGNAELASALQGGPSGTAGALQAALTLAAGGITLAEDPASLLADTVRAAQSTGGAPLPAALCAPLSRALGGVALDGVRLHLDAKADAAAKAAHAEAFTLGTHIFFRAAAWRPGSPEGRELLLHELAHVLQGPAMGGDSDGFSVSSPSDTLEQAAHQLAREASAGLGAGEDLGLPTEGEGGAWATSGGGVVSASSPSAGVIHRQPSPGPAPSNRSGKALELESGNTTVGVALDNAIRYLGPNYLNPSPGRYVSQDGMRQVRLGDHETEDPDKLHIHFEAYNKPAQEGGKVIENAVVKLVDENQAQDDNKSKDDGKAKSDAPGSDETPADDVGSETSNPAKREQDDPPPPVETPPPTETKSAAEDSTLPKPETQDPENKTESAATPPTQTPLGQKLIDGLKENAKVKLFEEELFQEDASVYSYETKDQPGMFGSTTSTKVHGLHVEATGTASGTLNSDGLNVGASVQGKATLADFEKSWDWEVGSFSLLGEEVSGHFFLKASGMIGAEGAAQLDLNVGKVKGARKVDPNSLLGGKALAAPKGSAGKESGQQKEGSGAAVTASAEAFAGAKLTLGAGLAARWKRKEPSAYKDKLADASAVVLDLVTVISPGLGWLLQMAGAEEVVQEILGALIAWGGAGEVSLLGIEASLTGSAGVGGKLQARLGFTGGKFSLTLSANATWGLGLGTDVLVTLDAIEGVKFALIVMGELRSVVDQWLASELDALKDEALERIDSIFEWFSADDVVRDAVKHGAHLVVGAAEKAQMVRTLADGVCGDEDEDAILSILEAAKAAGHLSEVVSKAGGADALLWDLDGGQDAKLRELLGMD